jgi:hypothetical protein
MALKRIAFQCILVVTGCKDDFEINSGHFFQHVKAIHLRHFNIQGILGQVPAS